MSKLLPYETIVKAHEGDPDAVNAEVEEYVKQQLIAALFKFRFDR